MGRLVVAGERHQPVAQYNGEPAASASVAMRKQLKKKLKKSCPSCHGDRRHRARRPDQRLRSDSCHTAATASRGGASLDKPNLDKSSLDQPKLDQF